MTAESSSLPKYRLNVKPRLSANQLAEYLNASSTRRKRIIQDAKFPKTVIIARYDGARNGISEFLCDNARPTSTLVGAIDKLSTKATNSESAWTKQDSLLSVEAIEAFHKAYYNNKMGVRKIECRPIVGNQPALVIEGTQISIALNATTHRKHNSGKDYVGGLLLLLNKGEVSTSARAERCRLAAVLVLMFAQANLKYLGAADPKLCFALDVFGGTAYPAPANYKQRLNNITAACEEVRMRWDSIDPPDDYDGPDWK